jgi:hypothetical protein
MDDLLRQMLADPEREEAQSWLTGGDERFIFEFGPEESLAMVQELYALGAKEVLAVQIDKEPDMESTNTLVVALPSENDERGAVFRWVNDYMRECGFDPTGDEGQSHLLVFFT